MTVDDAPLGKSKPDPYMLQLILERENISNKEVLFVSDAKNTGIKPVVVLSGLISKLQAEKLGVKYIIPDITKIESILT